MSKSRPSSDPSAPLIDDARLGKKLTLPLLGSVFNLHFNAFASGWEFCPALLKIQNSKKVTIAEV